jgi:glucose/arabinose dehydrogenase
MSAGCPPASASIVNLYATAADKVEFYSEINKICEAKAVTDINIFGNTAAILAHCRADSHDHWKSAIISSPDNILMITVTLDSPIEVRPGDTVMLSVTLVWY